MSAGRLRGEVVAKKACRGPVDVSFASGSLGGGIEQRREVAGMDWDQYEPAQDDLLGQESKGAQLLK